LPVVVQKHGGAYVLPGTLVHQLPLIEDQEVGEISAEGTLTHLPRNDIPSGILSSNVTFLRATYFVPAVCDDRANQFFEKLCIRPMRPENARIRLPAGLASPELGCTGSCRDRAGLNHRSLKSLTQTAIWSWWN